MLLMECLCLWVQDVDFERSEILVRDGKGMKDRVTMLPNSVVDALRVHLVRATECTIGIWPGDSARSMETLNILLRGRIAVLRGACSLAYLLDMWLRRNSPWNGMIHGSFSRGSRSVRLALHPARGFLQRFPIRPSPWTRNAPTRCDDIRAVQELPGHADVYNTMVYTHVLNKSGRGVVRPQEL